MSQLVTVVATEKHGNSYGEKYSKAKGAKYDVPADVAAHLEREGLVKPFTGEEPEPKA